MKVIVFGASGKAGGLVAEKALAAGHDVTAFSHGDGDAPPTRSRRLRSD